MLIEDEVHESVSDIKVGSWVKINHKKCRMVNLRLHKHQIRAKLYLDNIHVDHAWDCHEQNYNQICEKLSLTKTNFIHVAKRDNKAVGIANILNQS